MSSRCLALVLVCTVGSAHAEEKKPERKPVRVLLAAGGPATDYQYLRALLARETDEKRAEFSIYLQPASDGPRAGVDQLVPPERMLEKFPDRLGKDEQDPNKRFADLASYDVIVAFDLDWARLSEEQLKVLRQWVEERRGGLVVVAGPLYTYRLAAPKDAKHVKPLTDLLPVVLGDSRLTDRKSDRPFRLTFAEGKTDVPFLKLDDADKPLSFWNGYFGKENEPERGFYSCYPVTSVKQGATVYATFDDPSLKTADRLATPYLATASAGKGRVAYLGSAEMWRVRRYKEQAHERFWTSLIGFVAPQAK
jgi:hypothetical protein